MEFDRLVEDADAMAKATIVERNARYPNRLDVLWAPYLVSGLRIVALLNQFRLLSANPNLPVPDSIAA
jgi:phage tail sheath gpL-like